MRIHGIRVADILQLDVSGDLDSALLDTIRQHLFQGQKRFVVNLEELVIIGDAGVAQLVEARSLVLEADGYFALALPEELLRKRSGWRDAPFRFETAQEAVESLLRE